jgi:predicted RNA-binding protein YlxR (DUF448 family)
MPRRNEPTERMCVVTREVKPTAELLRFVADPDGALVLDLKHRLPGRGVWVSAEADIVRQAARKNTFARALKAPVRTGEDLAERVEEQLKRSLLAALSLARKGGGLVTGFDAVEAAIGRGQVAALIHAGEAGDDGVGKLQAALKRRLGPGSDGIPVLRRLSESELSLALGRPHVIHAALLAGRAGRLALDHIGQLARFHAEPQGGGIHLSSRKADQAAEHRNT